MNMLKADRRIDCFIKMKQSAITILPLQLAILCLMMTGCQKKELPPPVPPANEINFGPCLIGLQYNRSLELTTKPVKPSHMLSFTAPIVGGADRKAFQHGITQKTTTIEPMGKIQIPIIFTPVAQRTHTAQLHVEVLNGSIWGKSPFVLKGEGRLRIHHGELAIIDDVHKTQSVMEFGNSFINPANPPKHVVKIHNKGTSSKNCHLFFGDPGKVFRLKAGTKNRFTIPAGRTHQITIEFHPEKPESYQVPVLIEDMNNTENRTGVILTGTGRY